MKQHLVIILSTITLYTYTMEIEKPTEPAGPCWFLVLPLEIQQYIGELSCPKMNLYYDKDEFICDSFPEQDSDKKDKQDGINATQNLHALLAIIMKLLTIDKHLYKITSNNIVTWLDLNQNNINAFLIRSTQAYIPYFIKLAFNTPPLKADPDFVHKPDGYTPLLCATTNNHCDTCKFLLEKGASVNIRRKNPRAAYSYNPDNAWPIQIAIAHDNNQLVTLFIKHRAKVDFSNFGACTPLLSLTVQKNNPYILSALLKARPYTCWYDHWHLGEIEDALEIAQHLPINTNQEKFEKKKKRCITMLEKAKKHEIQRREKTM